MLLCFGFALFGWRRARAHPAGWAVALQMPARQVQVDRGVLQVAMAEQQLNGAQIGAGFEQVSGEAVAQGVGVDVLAEAGALARPADRRARQPCRSMG